MKTNWTTNNPTQDGLYWFRSDHTQAPPRIVNVWGFGMGCEPTVMWHGRDNESILAEMSGYWFGPLEVPDFG